MAFPLKSGADLYNQQLIRAAIWNHGADPSETVTGLLYFNTSNSSAAKKLRLYTGSAWKTIAFEEDLDVANNADFQTLKRKVEAFLEGGVDSDGVLNKLSEIQSFLDNYSSATDLTEILDTKLDKSGGAINSSTTSTPFKILTSVSKYVALVMGTSEGNYGHFIYKGGSDWRVSNADWSVDYSLIHSGNIGEYNAGSADVIAKTYKNESINYRSESRVRMISLTESNSIDLGAPKQYVSGLSVMSDYVGWQLVSGASEWDNTDFYIRKLADNGKYLAWKQIAFTDSNVASAQALVHSNGAVGATVRDNGAISISEYLILKNNRYYAATLNDGTTERNILGINSANNLLVGYGSRWDGKTLIYGDGIECIIKDTPAFLINSSGNVGIGTPDPQHKLHVGGDIVATGTIACKGIAAEGDAMDMVDKTVLYIAPSTTQQTFTLNHGLGTREIAISIYERTSMGWNMILTDVEIVDDNKISVSFGNPPSENHMVVVMG